MVFCSARKRAEGPQRQIGAAEAAWAQHAGDLDQVAAHRVPDLRQDGAQLTDGADTNHHAIIHARIKTGAP